MNLDRNEDGSDIGNTGEETGVGTGTLVASGSSVVSKATYYMLLCMLRHVGSRAATGTAPTYMMMYLRQYSL